MSAIYDVAKKLLESEENAKVQREELKLPSEIARYIREHPADIAGREIELLRRTHRTLAEQNAIERWYQEQRRSLEAVIAGQEQISKIINKLNLHILCEMQLLGAKEKEAIARRYKIPLEYVLLVIHAFEKGGIMSLIQQEIIAQVRESVLEVAPLAAKLLRDIITGEIPAPLGVRAKYASEALARVGFGPITKSVSHSMREIHHRTLFFC